MAIHSMRDKKRRACVARESCNGYSFTGTSLSSRNRIISDASEQLDGSNLMSFWRVLRLLLLLLLLLVSIDIEEVSDVLAPRTACTSSTMQSSTFDMTIYSLKLLRAGGLGWRRGRTVESHLSQLREVLIDPCHGETRFATPPFLPKALLHFDLDKIPLLTAPVAHIV